MYWRMTVCLCNYVWPLSCDCVIVWTNVIVWLRGCVLWIWNNGLQLWTMTVFAIIFLLYFRPVYCDYICDCVAVWLLCCCAIVLVCRRVHDSVTVCFCDCVIASFCCCVFVLLCDKIVYFCRWLCAHVAEIVFLCCCVCDCVFMSLNVCLCGCV